MLGLLSVGLGIGATAAPAPIASADASSDWSATVNTLLGGLPAEPVDTNLAISFDGMNLIDDGTATAHTISGQFGLAIAIGAGSIANAQGGNGDFAFADGANALANAGSLTTGATGNDYDTAVDIGNNTSTSLVSGAFAGNGSISIGTDATASSHDTAVDIGNNSGGTDGAFATAGNGNTAYDFGNNSGLSDGANASLGNNNYAVDSGNNSNLGEGAFAGFGNSNSAIADTNYTGDAAVTAFNGNNNIAYVYGPANSDAVAGGNYPEFGNGNIAYVFDPFGSSAAPDSAFAGSTSTAAGSNDLAEVLLTHGEATARGANLLYDIITAFGTQTNTAAAGGVSSLADAFGTATNVPAAIDPAATASATPAFAYSDLTTAISEDYAAGQAGFATAATDFSSADVGGGLAGLFEGIDDDTLIAPQNLIIGTAETLANEPLKLFNPPGFGVPDTYAAGLLETQQLIQVGENMLSEAPTSLASGDYPAALLETFNGIDFTTIFPLETFILSGFAAS